MAIGFDLSESVAIRVATDSVVHLTRRAPLLRGFLVSQKDPESFAADVILGFESAQGVWSIRVFVPKLGRTNFPQEGIVWIFAPNWKKSGIFLVAGFSLRWSPSSAVGEFELGQVSQTLTPVFGDDFGRGIDTLNFSQLPYNLKDDPDATAMAAP